MQEIFFKISRLLAMIAIALAAVVYVFQFGRSVDKIYPGKTFSVDGIGDIDTIPDVAKFSASVITEGGKNIVELQSVNAEKMNKINHFLKENGIEKKDLKTVNYDIYPKYGCIEPNCARSEIIGYTINQSLDIKIRKIENMSTILSGMVGNGANNISDIKFVIDDEESAKNLARLEAIEKAKNKAEVMARAGGFRLGKILTLYEETNLTRVTNQSSEGLVMAEKIKTPEVEPGIQSTRMQVTLTYEILD